MNGRTLFVSRDIIKKGESPVFDTERDALACLDSLIMDEESVICWNDADISESIYPSLSELAKEIGAIDRIETGPGGRLDITRKVPLPASSGSHRLEIDGLADIAIEISPVDAGRDKTFSLIGTDEILEIGEKDIDEMLERDGLHAPQADCSASVDLRIPIAGEKDKRTVTLALCAGVAMATNQIKKADTLPNAEEAIRRCLRMNDGWCDESIGTEEQPPQTVSAMLCPTEIAIDCRGNRGYIPGTLYMFSAGFETEGLHRNTEALEISDSINTRLREKCISASMEYIEDVYGAQSDIARAVGRILSDPISLERFESGLDDRRAECSREQTDVHPIFLPGGAARVYEDGGTAFYPAKDLALKLIFTAAIAREQAEADKGVDYREAAALATDIDISAEGQVAIKSGTRYGLIPSYCVEESGLSSHIVPDGRFVRDGQVTRPLMRADSFDCVSRLVDPLLDEYGDRSIDEHVSTARRGSTWSRGFA